MYLTSQLRTYTREPHIVTRTLLFVTVEIDKATTSFNRKNIKQTKQHSFSEILGTNFLKKEKT